MVKENEVIRNEGSGKAPAPECGVFKGFLECGVGTVGAQADRTFLQLEPRLG